MIVAMYTYCGSREPHRLSFLKESMATFLKTRFPPNTRIVIADDGSKIPDVKKILGKVVAPKNTTIEFIFREKNLGCDVNMCKTIKYAFGLTDDQYVITCDSDVYYHPEWINKLVEAKANLKGEKIGMLTCFDTRSHTKIRHVTPDIIEKKSCGGFCAMINRELFMNPKLQTEAWDHKYIAMARERGFKFFCTDPSYVQHCGKGKSGMGLSWDVAHNFVGLPEDHYVECCNEDCGWEGLSTACVTFKHDDKPLCPKCNEVVEPRQCDDD